jgi:hypothetical protein
MDEAARIALVRKAIALYPTRFCLEYVDDGLYRRVQRELSAVGTPKGIKEFLVAHSANGGGITCRIEDRAERMDRREFWYKATVAIEGFPKRLFYELELVEPPDEDCPSVVILNVHF